MSRVSALIVSGWMSSGGNGFMAWSPPVRGDAAARAPAAAADPARPGSVPLPPPAKQLVGQTFLSARQAFLPAPPDDASIPLRSSYSTPVQTSRASDPGQPGVG